MSSIKKELIKTELRNNSGTFFVPFSDYTEENKPLWAVGFEDWDITIVSDKHLKMGYQEAGYTHWGDISIDLYITGDKLVIKGKGSRNFRESIINAYNWFVKAKSDDTYIALFTHTWFDEPFKVVQTFRGY